MLVEIKCRCEIVECIAFSKGGAETTGMTWTWTCTQMIVLVLVDLAVSVTVPWIVVQ